MSRGAGLADVASAAALPDAARGALRDLLLTLADNKRLLGMRYADRVLGSPSLETGIAAASIAQDEWGHSRLTYALLSDFGDDPASLEHERAASQYHSMELLDSPFSSWVALIAACLVLDGALTIQYEALRESRYVPVRNRVQKLLNEELLHFQYAAGWLQKIASSPLSGELEREIGTMLPTVLRWFGPVEEESGRVLLEAQLVGSGPEQLRTALLDRVAPVLERAGFAEALGVTAVEEVWRYEPALRWPEWNERVRRSMAGGPDEETIARVRGDSNRAMLLD